MASTPDILPEQIQLRPALSSTGDVPVFLSQSSPPADAAPEATPPASEEASPDTPADEIAGGEPQETAEETTTGAAPAPRIDPRTVRAREQDARIARLEGLLEKALGALGNPQTPPVPPPQTPPIPPLPEATPRPRRTDFVDPDAYDDAYAEWVRAEVKRDALADQARQAHEAAAKKAQDDRAAADKAAQDAQIIAAKAYDARKAKFIETHPDYEEVAYAENLQISDAMAQTITHTDDGPMIAYWLGQNPTEAARIAAIQLPAMVVYELGQIAARIKAVPPPQVSRAPRPIKPLGSNAAATEKTLEEVGAEGSMEEYAARREPALRAQRQRNTMIGTRLN